MYPSTKSKLRVFAILGFLLAIPVTAEASKLLQRESPTPATTNGVPHVQINVEADPAISAELLSQVSKIRGVEIRETVISLPGAKGFWINENVTITRPNAIVGGREFAHMHPDGSLHASLPPELAAKAVKLGWAIYHPWAKQRPGWEGFVMIYTPNSRAELDTVVQLVMGGYNYVTGSR